MMKNASRSFEELEEDEDYQSEFGMETPFQDQSINSCSKPIDRKHLKLSKEHYIEDARNFQVIKRSDDHRCANAHKNGGFPLNDQEAINKFRQAIKTIISKLGRQLLSGKLNLANITFPIWCMSP